MSKLLFNKDQFCKVAQDSVVFILTSSALRMIGEHKNRGGVENRGLVRMKSRDYVVYFLVNLGYYMFIPSASWFPNVTDYSDINNSVYHAVMLIAGKSIVDYAIFNEHNKFMENIIAIGASEVVGNLVSRVRASL